MLRWDAADASASPTGSTTVTMAFAPTDDGRTLVTIAEEGWTDSAAGRTASYGNCEGWTGMLCALKAWIEHGATPRAGLTGASRKGYRACARAPRRGPFLYDFPRVPWPVSCW